jgi:4-hydroxyproline epimerase
MRVIDSHTEGEPTRLIVSGGPDLGHGPLAERRRIFAERYDHVRAFTLDEPRGFDAMVGALLCEPVDPGCAAGLIFFNNVGFLGMCGHATIGAAVTLAHMGRIGPGAHRFETPVGIVGVELRGRNEVTFENVPSHVFRKGLKLEVEGQGIVTGDVAWSGNWFFLIDGAPCPIERVNIPELTRAARAVRSELFRAGHRGDDGAEIDHVEFFVRNPPGGADSRNFLLCPGGAYDRSPSGTGTSAKLACLAAEGALEPGAPWIQESVTGGRFLGRYKRAEGGAIRPSITGRAWVTAEATLIADPADPFLDGLTR